MPDHLIRCIFEQLTKSPSEVVSLRIQRVVKLWTSWAKELAKDEAQLKSTLDPRVRQVLGQKRLLLMKKVAQQIEWPDSCLFDELSAGFRVVGSATPSNVFQQGLKAATISEEQLMSDARFLKPALLGKIRSGGASEHSRELFDITVVEKSWLKGPLSPAEVDEVFGRAWLPVRRFPVEQKGKLRPIDDLRRIGLMMPSRALRRPACISPCLGFSDVDAVQGFFHAL